MAVKCNMGMADRIVRIVIGISLILFALAGLFPGVWRIIMPVIGLVPILTAVFGFCPAYRLFGLSSAKH